MNEPRPPQPADADAEPAERTVEVRYEFTPLLPQVLETLNASIMVTTYQAGKLLVLGVHDGALKISFTSFEQPMGLAIDGDRMALGSRRQIHSFQANRQVAPSVRPQGTFDVCFVPRESASTGSIHGHDLAWGTDGLWVVNTLFSCLCTLHDEYSFVPRWQPPFISRLIDEDRCHLNGLAIVNGVPRFVTAMSETDTAAGWRPTKATSGVILNVESGQVVTRGLSMPHSPRWHNGRLWVLDSGYGALCTVDLQTGKRETVATFPGYTRGLSFCGQFAFVGLSRIRETSVFGGVPIAEYRNELKCGVGVVDLTAGRTVAVFQFLSGVTEIFAVESVPGTRCPLVAGASADGQERDVWIVPPPGTTPRLVSREPWYARRRNPATAATGQTVVPESTAAEQPADLESWLAAHPDDASGWVTLGNLRQEQSRQFDALTCYQRAAAADATCIPALQNLGYLQFNLGMPEEAQATYDALLSLSDTPLNRLLAASVMPVIYESASHAEQWRTRQVQALQQLVDDGRTVDASIQLVPTAFFWAYQGRNDVEVMRLRGQILRGCTDVVTPAPSADRRLRVGFLSAYLRDHTIGRLNVGRIELLDRTKFHVTVCLASPARDAFVARFRAAADRFVDVPRDVPAAIRLMRSLDLDVLVFCDVGMDALCSTLAFSRLAPVQCATWGHPDTTGSPTMDFFLSSELLETSDADAHYTEALVRMPVLGTFYERPGGAGQAATAEPVSGLPEGSRIYACPQSLFKFHPDFDSLLRGILERDPQARVVGIEGRVPEWTSRLRRRWETTLPNVADRIVLLPPLPNPQFLSLLAQADVVLDPIHFGGGNSSYETFACGTPIVTLPGEFLRSRITAALYRQMGLDDLISSSPEEYIEAAVTWASDAAVRDQVRRRIAENSAKLFCDPDEVRCLEYTLLRLAGR